MTKINGALNWPQGAVVQDFEGVSIKMDAHPHPFVTENKSEIDKDWQKQLERNPALYNGNLLMMRKISHNDNIICATAHEVPFSAYLYWRSLDQCDDAFHLHGLPVIISRDKKVIAIRMSPHTANPGLVYCAAGSLESADVVNGFAHIDLNMQREVMEETGLNLQEAVVEAAYHGVLIDRTVSVFRLYHFDLDADKILDKVAVHMQQDEEKEIDSCLAICDDNPHAHKYPPFMPVVLKWVFPRL